MTDFDAQVEKTNDFLAHYGVPGMKWGKRKADDSGSSKPDIKGARERVGAKVDEAYGNLERNATKAQKKFEDQVASNKNDRKLAVANASNRQEKKVAKAEYKVANREAAAIRDKTFDKIDKAYEKAQNAIINDPDYETANRMTTGEKWMTGVGLGMYGVALAGSIGTMAYANRQLNS